MADIMIRKRKRMRTKEIKALSKELEECLGAPVFSDSDPVDLAESSEFDVLFVGNDIIGLILGGKPFLTVRGVIKYKPPKKYVTVDMGAVPFLINGADCMGPGITDAEDSIQPGDFVWIRDMKNLVPLAIGISERSGEELRSKKAGKAVKSVTYVGDRLWKSGE